MYTSVGMVKAYLGDVQPNASEDMLIAGFVAAAQKHIDDHWHQVYEAAEDSTRYLDAIRNVEGRRLWLGYPLCAITSVTNGDGVVVAPSAYFTESSNETPWWAITLKSNSAVSWTYSDAPENAIAIVGRWAYSIAPDAVIQQAAARLAAYLYRQRDNGFDLDRMIQTQNGLVMPLDLPGDIGKLLAPYRRFVP